MKTKKLTYPPHLYSAWKKGRIHCKWFKKYRKAFDEDDLRIVRNQHTNGNHFGEWFTARHYAKEGFRVLVEKYSNKNHRRKQEVILELLGNPGLNLLRTWRKEHHCQAPDLFVCKGKRCFFVEVKRARDFLRDVKSRFFRKIERALRKPVVILDLQPKGTR